MNERASTTSPKPLKHQFLSRISNLSRRAFFSTEELASGAPRFWSENAGPETENRLWGRWLPRQVCYTRWPNGCVIRLGKPSNKVTYMALLAQLHLLLPSGKATKQRTLISLHGLSGLNVKKQVSKSTVLFCMCYLACNKKASVKTNHVGFWLPSFTSLWGDS